MNQLVSIEIAILISTWVIIHGLLFFYSYWSSMNDYSLGNLQQSLSHSFYVARAAAFVINIDSALVLIVMCRNVKTFASKIWKKFVPSCFIRFACASKFIFLLDNSTKWHQFLGLTIGFMAFVHTLAHYINFLKLQNLTIKTESQAAIHQRLISNCSLLTSDCEAEKSLQKTLAEIQKNNLHISEKLNFLTIAGATGNILLLACFIIWTGYSLRRILFKAFYQSHCSFALIYFGAILTHGCGCFLKSDTGKCLNPTTFKFVSASLILYTIESIWRWCRRPVKVHQVIEHPSRVLEIRFEKGKFRSLPGQYVLLKCPQIDGIWHPFTLTNAPDDEFYSVHIRLVGEWTKKLFDLCLAQDTAKALSSPLPEVGTSDSIILQLLDDNPYSLTRVKSADPVKIRVMPIIFCDGPFGSDKSPGHYRTCVLVGAGIGVTPFASILRNYWYCRSNIKSDKIGKQQQQIFFIWICNDFECFEWFQTLLKDLEKTLENDPSLKLDILVYLTSKEFASNEIYVKNVMLSNGHLRDAITGLSSATRYGRPNFKILFQHIAYQSLNDPIGVYCCGPISLSDSIWKAIKETENLTQDVVFHFHQEHF